jgi:DNA-binding GntR family transcriptional regulator
MVILEERQLKSDIVYRKLKELIISDQLKQGAPLSERKLCQLFDASRTPVRDALKKLHNDGFVDLSPDIGATVSRLTYDHVYQIYDIREMLEALAIRLFTDNASASQISRVQKMFDSLEKTIKEKKYKDGLKIDLNFHDYIFEESNNPLLKKMLLSIFEQISRIINLTQYTDEWAEEALEQHRAILEKILARDSEGAEKAMRIHTRNSKRHQLEQWIKK